MCDNGHGFVRATGSLHSRALARTCTQLRIENSGFPYTIYDPLLYGLRPEVLGKPPHSPIMTLRLVMEESRAWRGLTVGHFDTLKALPKLKALLWMVKITGTGARARENGAVVQLRSGGPLVTLRDWEMWARDQVRTTRPDITVEFEYEAKH
jgi:hypothetical protein